MDLRRAATPEIDRLDRWRCYSDGWKNLPAGTAEVPGDRRWEKPYWLFCVPPAEPELDEPLSEPEVAPEEGDEPEPPAVPPELPLGEAEEPEDELELGLDGVAPEDELDDGLLDDPPELMPLELELEGDFLVASLDDEPEAEPDAPVEPEVAPEPAPRFASPALSQP